MNEQPKQTNHGLMAEFEEPQELLEAAERSYAAGYRQMDAYSPLPIHGLASAIGFKQTNLGILVFACGLLGAICGYGLQYWIHVIDYPVNIGGKPFHSGLMFIPVTFELPILFAAFGAVFGMIIRNNLPMPYHPVFNVPSFARASQDRFFLCIESSDPQYSETETRQFLESLKPHEVSSVAA